jgi:ferric enterobactin receptor
MKRLFITLTLLLLGCTIYAQRPNFSAGGRNSGPTITGNISGTLVDSIAGTPIEFATVVLIDAKTEKQIDGGLTDEKGDFKLSEIKLGTYNLSFTFMGYRSKEVKGITLTGKEPDYKFDNIFLVSEGVNLEEVEVVGQEVLIENKIDKLVYNADKDVTTRGGDATDVLRNVPLLEVDFDGNVSLRGASNVTILINGKLSTLFGSNPGEALQTISADQIKSVEVVTTPTAKYDGEGTAGIINIITKKKSIEGFTGSVSTAIGNRNNRANINTNLARGRFGLNANVSSYFTWPLDRPSEFYRENTVNGVTSTLSQIGVGRGASYGPRGGLSAFYDFNAYNSINTSLSFFGRGGNNDSRIDAISTGLFEQEYTRLVENASLGGGFDWTTDYRKKFKNPEQEFSMAFQLSGNKTENESTIFQEGSDPSLFRDERNDNDGLNLEYTLQSDYVHPFSQAVKLETGVKAILRRIDSDYLYEERLEGDTDFSIDESRTDEFAYVQDVYAGYASFNLKFGENWGVVAGARYELTDISGDFRDDPTTFGNDYGNFLPSFIISRNFKNFSSLKASYTRRIQRPSLRTINPYIQVEDNRNISFGNPDLNPELTDQYDLTYNAFIKGLVINASVFYRNTTQTIENFTDVAFQDDGGIVTTIYDQSTFTDEIVDRFLNEVEDREVSFNTFRNIGRAESIGFSLIFFQNFCQETDHQGWIYAIFLQCRSADR